MLKNIWRKLYLPYRSWNQRWSFIRDSDKGTSRSLHQIGHPLLIHLSESIITDNAWNLNNDMMNSLCAQFKIHYQNSTPYKPKMNGAVEATNKNIQKILQKMTETCRDWHKKFPFALFAYRTSLRPFTRAAPFSLVYVWKLFYQLNKDSSLRILVETKLEEAEWFQT